MKNLIIVFLVSFIMAREGPVNRYKEGLYPSNEIFTSIRVVNENQVNESNLVTWFRVTDHIEKLKEVMYTNDNGSSNLFSIVYFEQTVENEDLPVYEVKYGFSTGKITAVVDRRGHYGYIGKTFKNR